MAKGRKNKPITRIREQATTASYDFVRDVRSRSFMTGLYIGIAMLFIGAKVQGGTTEPINFFTGFYLMIPLFSGLLGLEKSWRVPLENSNTRTFLRLFSAGMVFWSIGCVIWVYYNFHLKQEIPYPSWADAGYLTFLLCSTVGIFFLYRVAKADWWTTFKDVLKSIGLGSGFVLLIMSWAHGGSPSNYVAARELFKFLLDVSYPVVDAFNLTVLMILIIRRSMNRKMKRALWWIAAGYLLVLLADLSFNIITSLPKNSPLGNRFGYYNGGPTDFAFATAFWILGIGLSYLPISNDRSPIK